MRHISRRTLGLGLILFFLAVIARRPDEHHKADPHVGSGVTPSHSIPAGGRSRAATTLASAVGARDSADDTPAIAPESALVEFEKWTRDYLAASADERESLVARGEQLAAQRRVEMAALIQNDPERALNKAVSVKVRQELPPAVVQQLETRVDGQGNLAVIAAMPEVEGSGTAVKPIERFVSFPEQTFRAFVYGRRLQQVSTDNIPLHGIAIDESLAVHESPVRALEAGETPDPSLAVDNVNGHCPISKQAADRAVAAQVGNKIVYLCTGSHIAALGEELAQAENTPSPALASTWSQGVKNVLFIRVNYPDDLTESISDVNARTMMTNVSNWYLEGSYGTTEMATTVTPLLTLPKTKTWYTTNDNYLALLADARTVAKTAGYDTANYDLDCVHFASTFSGWSGRGYVGGKGTWLQSGNNVGVPCHEFGHNYGLWHANFWNATGDTIIGPGSNTEYGNVFDTMGSASAGDRQFNAYEKNRLAWIPDTNVRTVTNSGLFRLYAFDVPALTNGFDHALKIHKDTRDYWVELRQKFTSNKWIQNGVLLNWSAWANSAGGSQLLDTTPGSPTGNSSRDDAGVVVGRTFSDPFAGIHITPLVKNATTPPSIDVMINLGFFPDNHPPTVAITASAATIAPNGTVTFSATASDPDGDTLAYYWDFGDLSFGTNGPTAAKTWSSGGDYVVRCTVTDMKGGTSSDAVLVTVGTPSTYRLAGRVTAAGQPLDGVRVSVSTKIAYTDADGYYTLTGLSGGANAVSAVKAGFDLAPVDFTNPVTLGPNASNVDFVATATTYSISGRVTDNNAPVPGVVVGIGTNLSTTVGDGSFVLVGLPAGGYTLSASKPGYEFAPSPGWSNPVAIEWGDVTNAGFVRPLFLISGIINGASGAAVVSIGETNHQTTAYSNRGKWNYSLMAPQGNWNLGASLVGATIKPSSFTNPVAIVNSSGGIQGGTAVSYDFSAVAGVSYVISGSVFDDGAPVAGIRVAAGSSSAVTDTAGRYQVIGLTNGTYTLVPAGTNYTFSPSSLPETINNGNALNADFTAALLAGPLVLTHAENDVTGFRFILSGPPNHPLRIEASSDLILWEPLALMTNVTGEVQFADGARTNAPRFYRAVQLP